MQGSLHELDIATLCQIIAREQKTGELWVEANDRHGQPQQWLVFFELGKVIYASNGSANLDRLQDYLFGMNLDSALTSSSMQFVPQLGKRMLEYEQLWWLMAERVLAPAQAIAIINAMIEEVIFDLLCLKEGLFTLNLDTVLRPQLVSQPLVPLLRNIQAQVQQWYQLFPHIPSLDHCPKPSDPIDADNSAFNLLLPLEPWIDLESNPSLRQIARYRLAPVIHIVKETYEAIVSGVVLLTPPPTPTPTPTPAPHILCIDDSLTACRSLEYILREAGYQVSISTDPISAISTALQLQPQLILCDITMPQLSGYELCAMLKQTHQLAHTPIIMVTSNEGYLDRSQARLSGSSGYLTKPVTSKELLAIIAKHLNRA